MNRIFLAMVLILVSAFGAASYQGTSIMNSADKRAITMDKKIAIIDSRAFPNGLNEYKRSIDKLETEFQPRVTELETLKNRMLKQEEELKSFIVKDPDKDLLLYKQKAIGLQKIKKEFERKREDYQEEIQSRYDEALTPLRDKIYKSLERYGGVRELTLILDMSTLTEQGSLLYFDPAANITAGFIKEYNSQNP